MEWRPVPGYEECYEVSDQGQVKSIERYVVGRWGNQIYVPEKILKPSIHTGGYYWISGTRKGKKVNFSIARAVAKAFIPNPENKPQVDHIDCNKANNTVSNLRWVTAKENIHFAEENGLRDHSYQQAKEKMQDPDYKARLMKCRDESKRKKTYCYSLDGELLGEYVSCTAAAKANGVGATYVSRCCRGMIESLKDKRYSYQKI